ncbi:MAG: hypothetical protein E7256_08155 [Lachnospiraceae bacterium]|nr:hypothetical protein [Lachnospiraceae bacterium]
MPTPEPIDISTQKPAITIIPNEAGTDKSDAEEKGSTEIIGDSIDKDPIEGDRGDVTITLDQELPTEITEDQDAMPDMDLTIDSTENQDATEDTIEDNDAGVDNNSIKEDTMPDSNQTKISTRKEGYGLVTGIFVIAAMGGAGVVSFSKKHLKKK